MKENRAQANSPARSISDVTAIVPAAGLGNRFGPGVRKQYTQLGGKAVLSWVLDALETHPRVAQIIPVVREKDLPLLQELISSGQYSKLFRPVIGGAERQDSVYSALKSISSPHPYVLVHDGVRPFLSQSLITRCIGAIEGHDGAIVAVPPKDTIKQGGDNIVIRTLDRSALWLVQTPQAFKADTLLRAYQSAMSEGVYSTDDSALVERMGGRIAIVTGYYENIKVTTPDDIAIADAIIKRGLPE